MASTKMTTRALPRTVRIDTGGGMTPNEMRFLKEHTGRSLTDLLGGDSADMDMAPDRLQALVFIQLRREGYDPTWDEAGDVVPDFSEVTPDPTNGDSSKASLPSASSGA